MPDPTPATGIALTKASREARKAWVDRNPLRTWRLAHEPKVTILEAAERIGVGMSMVQMYERGVHRPSDAKATTFAALLGDDWSDRWDQWLAAKPTD